MIESLLNKSEKENILKLFTSMTKNDEFEIMFNNYKSDNKLTIMDFMKVLKYIKFRSTQDKLVLKNDTTLDIIYSYSEKLEKYRISILDLDEINSLLNLLHKRKNNIIFSIFL